MTEDLPKPRRGRPPGSKTRVRTYKNGTEYLLAVINGDVAVPVALKVKAAIALVQREATAPKGVKNLRQEAAALIASSGDFQPPAAPVSQH